MAVRHELPHAQAVAGAGAVLGGPFSRRKDRLRRELLRGLLDENIEILQGLPFGTLRRRRRNRWAMSQRLLLVAAVAGLVAIGVTAWVGWRVDAPPEVAALELPMLAGAGPADDTDPTTRARRVAQRLTAGDAGALVREVVPLAVNKVAIDPGHGGKDCGTSLGHGLLEKDLTAEIAGRLSKLLVAASCEVVMTRSADESVSLRERAAIANAAHADLFLSIHINWLPNREARGVETYYLGPTDDPFLRELAASENRDSGYSLADYRKLLEGLWADVRQDESRQVAENIQRSLHVTLAAVSPDLADRGVMTAPFAVLVATEMPAILAEVACLSNDREARLLAIPRYRQSIAEALFAGIWSYAEGSAPGQARADHPKGS